MYGYNAEQPIAIPMYAVLPYCVIYSRGVYIIHKEVYHSVLWDFEHSWEGRKKEGREGWRED